jgi:hypothetical protein
MTHMFHVEHCARMPQRGQSLVEFLLFVTLLIILLGGVLDLGGLLDTHLAITYAARQGALAAAAAGSDPAADCDALAAIAVALGNRTGLAVTHISIYQPGSDGLPLGGLGSATFADIYVGDPGCASAATPPAAQAMNWPSSSRTPTFTPPTMLGIEIDYTYSWQSALIALSPLSVIDHYVIPLTPG